MRERNIKISDVKTTILDPEHQELVFGSKFLAVRKFNNKVLEVIYFKKGNNFVIITTYWL